MKQKLFLKISKLLCHLYSIGGSRNEFPDITVECSLVYDRSLMQYRVNFTFTAPFSQATLDHIALFFFRRDIFRQLDPTNPNDITLVEGGRVDEPVNVSLVHNNINLIIILCV